MHSIRLFQIFYKNHGEETPELYTSINIICNLSNQKQICRKIINFKWKVEKIHVEVIWQKYYCCTDYKRKYIPRTALLWYNNFMLQLTESLMLSWFGQSIRNFVPKWKTLGYHIDFTNLLFCVFWACLATSTKINSINFQKNWCLHACKNQLYHSLLFLRDIVKILQTCHFGYFDHG